MARVVCRLRTHLTIVQGADLPWPPPLRLCRDLGNTQVTGDVSTWSAMTQATNMCAASVLSLCLASARRPCVDDVQGAYLPCHRLCRDLNSTQVTGDVSTWTTMTQATLMCAACALWPHLASTRRPCVNGMQGAYLPCHRLCRALPHTQVTGNVSGWSAMTRAAVMCAACALLPCLASTR